MKNVYAELSKLGLKLPDVPEPVASYEPAVVCDRVVYSSGQTGTKNGELVYKGKLGVDISEEDAAKSAEIAVLNCLAAIAKKVESLNNIQKIVRVTGYVASGEGFGNQPAVVEGASALILKLFGEAGKHARSAIGVSELPFGAPVEIEVIAKLNSEIYED